MSTGDRMRARARAQLGRDGDNRAATVTLSIGPDLAAFEQLMHPKRMRQVDALMANVNGHAEHAEQCGICTVQSTRFSAGGAIFHGGER